MSSAGAMGGAGGLGALRGPAAFAGAAAVLLLGAAVLAWGAWIAVTEITRQNGRYRDYEALQANAGKADSLSAAYSRIHGELRDLRAALPGQNPGAQVLERLVHGAKACSLSIAGITALDEIPFPGFRELPYEIEVAGGFKDLVRYLRDMETGGIAVQVRGMSIRAEAMNHSRIGAKLGISAFAPSALPASAPGASAKAPRDRAPR